MTMSAASPCRQASAVIRHDFVGGHCRHPLNRSFQRQCAKVAHIPGEHARECTEGARMAYGARAGSAILATLVATLGRWGRACIGVERNEVLLHRFDLVGFGHALRHGECPRASNGKKGIPRVLVQGARNLAQRFTIVGSKSRGFAASDHDALPIVSDVAEPILPGRVCLHLTANFDAHLRIV